MGSAPYINIPSKSNNLKAGRLGLKDVDAHVFQLAQKYVCLATKQLSVCFTRWFGVGYMIKFSVA